MIGCDKLCGKCEACYPLSFALGHAAHDFEFFKRIVASTDHINNPDMRDPWEACVAIIDPDAIAELLARALRGRGVECVSVPVSTSVHLHLRRRRNPVIEVFAMTLARAALSRILAAGLCSADEAMGLLEGT